MMLFDTSASANEEYSSDDRILILDLLLNNTLSLVVDALRNRKLRVPVNITEADLRRRIESALDNGDVSLADLIEVNSELEGWGRQQIYLYRYTGGKTIKSNWLNNDWVTAKFSTLQASSLFNRPRPIIMPEDPTLFSIEFNAEDKRISFIWAQKRIDYTRADEYDSLVDSREVQINDYSSQRIVFRAFREVVVRGVITFEWDIERNEAALMIYKHSDANYPAIRDQCIDELKDYLPILDFEQVAVSPVVTRLTSSSEVVRHNLQFQSLNNQGRINVSSGNKDDVFEDEVLEKARREIIDDVTGISGLVKWKKPDNKLMTVELYSRLEDDQRIGISAQELEDDIRHVLQRIRTYCS